MDARDKAFGNMSRNLAQSFGTKDTFVERQADLRLKMKEEQERIAAAEAKRLRKAKRNAK